MAGNSKDKLICGHYLVAFIDLLGQWKRLQKLDTLQSDKNSPAYKEFIKTVKDTVGAVDDLQRTAKEYFHAFTRNDECNALNSLPGFRKLNKTEIKCQHFSDGLVIYVPLRADDDYSPIKGVYGVLAACGMLCLLGLAKKRPVRIGVAMGIAAELRDNELYGKAVADAYEIESYIAQYPRVVVANDILDYLKSYTNKSCKRDDMVGIVSGKLAEDSMKLFGRDFDGRVIVNYLGEFFKKYTFDRILQLAYEYVNQQLKEHQQNQNTKLAFRYSLLHGYFLQYLEQSHK